MRPRNLLLALLAGAATLATAPGLAPQAQNAPPLPSGELAFGEFIGEFRADGSFIVAGGGWPELTGSWTTSGDELTLDLTDAPRGCGAPARFTYELADRRLTLHLIGTDECMPRRMILDGSIWRPADEEVVTPERLVGVRTAADRRPLPQATDSRGSWPSFRGPRAAGIADDANLPEAWNGETGDNILWRAEIPGLAHSSPIVWGDTVFVATAVSSDADATFRPGLYGDGDASADRSTHKWVVYAFDKRSGEIAWERVAYEGEPADKRHIKSTYASSTPATDGRIVVASFGSQGVFAYDMDGEFLWHLDVGRINLGAYDIPTFEWGPASSPIIWDGKVFLQYDTQQDSFLLALDAESGEILWRTERDELPSWGTPAVYEGPSGPELITNAANFIRGYDPQTGEELWRLAGSSKITAPTPIFTDDFIVVASGRGPEKPIFVLRPGARGDITLPDGQTSSDDVVWSIQRRGPYMPTPLIYDGVLYVLANGGVLDAYDLATGEELYRSRVPHLGSGFSGSPVAADGKIYLPSEDGDIVVIAAGRRFEHLATNPMGELLMATPAISDGVMYVRTVDSLFAIGH